jgi:Serine carboxypeptidase S28
MGRDHRYFHFHHHPRFDQNPPYNFQVVLFTPGEEAADGYTGYLTNKTITGLYAQEINGAVVMLERKSSSQPNPLNHKTKLMSFCCTDRYWGGSSPYTDLNAQNLQYLTLNNSIADLIYFAKNVQLPFDTNSSSNAQNAVCPLSSCQCSKL